MKDRDFQRRLKHVLDCLREVKADAKEGEIPFPHDCRVTIEGNEYYAFAVIDLLETLGVDVSEFKD